MFEMIFMGVLLLFAVIAVLTGLLVGKKYVWQYSVSKLILVLVSIFVAVGLSSALAWVCSGVLGDILHSALAETAEFEEVIDKLPSIEAVIRAIAAMVIACTLFPIIFLITKALLGLCKKPLAKLFLMIGKKEDAKSEGEQDLSALSAKEIKKIEKAKKNQAFRSTHKFDVLGGAIGALASLFVFVALLAPTVSGLSIINGVLQGVDDSMPAAVTEISDGAAENVAAKAIRFLGGDLIFDGLTSYPVGDNTVNAHDEGEFLAAAAEAISAISSEDADKEDAVRALKAFPVAFSKSTAFPAVLAEGLSVVSEYWSEGEEVFGIEAPSLGEGLEDASGELFASFAGSTPETIKQDVTTLSNTFVILIENDALEKITGEDANPIDLFREEEVISAVIYEILENDRLVPAVESVTNVAMSYVGDTLELIENKKMLYDTFMEDMYKAYIASEGTGEGDFAYDRIIKLADSIYVVYDEHGIEISKTAAICVAIDMLNVGNFKGAADMQSFFDPATEKNASHLISSIDHRVSAEIDDEEIAKIVGEEIAAHEYCATLTDEHKIELEARIATSIDKIFKKGDKLKYDQEVFENADAMAKDSVVVTSDCIVVDMQHISDKEKEARALAYAIGQSLALMDKLTAEGIEVEQVLSSFGPALDAFASCDSIGKAHTEELVSCLLQAKSIREKVGYTLVQATKVANAMNTGFEKGNSYGTLFKSIGNTIEVIKLSSSSSDSTEAVKNLIADLTPESAEALKEMTTVEVIQNYGVSEERAEAVSDTFTNMIDIMATVKQDGMTEEQYQKEAESVDKMLNIAMNANTSNGKNTFGEDSATGITADEFITQVSDSTVISQTIINATTDAETGEKKEDPLGIGETISEEEKQTIIEAIDDNWKAQLESSSDAQANADREQLLGSIGSLLGVKLEFTADGVVVK